MNKPIWEPGQDRIERANLNRFMRFVRERTNNDDIRRYAPLYDFSIRQPERFWQLVWEFCGIRANGDFEPALIDGEQMPGATWFPGVRLNFAQNLLRYKDDRQAIVFRNERGETRQISYAELHVEVARVAHALKSAGVGVGVGDRVAGLLPNIPEVIIAMLATASLGAIWSSCSPDFGVESLVDRFGQIQPKVLFCVDRYTYAGKAFDCLEKARGVLDRVPAIETLIAIPYAGNLSGLKRSDKVSSWADFVGTDNPALEFEMLPFDHPLYILYSSGTSGAPECIVHGAGGTLIQHLKELVLHTDLKREDRFFFHTTCGWMMWNWLISSLAVGSTIVLYDGSPAWPNADVLWDLADEVGITVFGTSARWLASNERAGLRPGVTHKLMNLRTILSTGSPLAPESYDYVYGQIKAKVLLASISGNTDIISCFALGNPLMPVYRGELQCRGLGMKVEILDGDVVRTNLSKGLGFSKEDRDTNIRRIGWVCEVLSRNGVVAIAAAISPYREIRDELRSKITNFVEIFVEAPIEVLAERDVKGLYKKALAGEIKNFTGVSDPYEPPLHAEVVCNSATETVEQSKVKIMTRLADLGYLV